MRIFAFASLLIIATSGAFFGGYALQEPVEAQATPQATRDHRDKCWIGISYTTDQWGGLLLTLVHIGSPAWKAGLVKGDTIVGVEVTQDGKPAEVKHGETIPWLTIGLATAEPETIFKVLVKRGDASKFMEKAVAVDFPRDKIEIPVAQAMIGHVKQMSKMWQQADFFWASIQSISYRDFTEHQASRIRHDLMELQIGELKERARTADLRRVKLLADIDLALTQKNVALAQQKAAEMKAQDDTAMGFIGLLLQICGF